MVIDHAYTCSSIVSYSVVVLLVSTCCHVVRPTRSSCYGIIAASSWQAGPTIVVTRIARHSHSLHLLGCWLSLSDPCVLHRPACPGQDPVLLVFNRSSVSSLGSVHYPQHIQRSIIYYTQPAILPRCE